MEKIQKVPLLLRLPVDVHKKVSKQAQEKALSMNSYITMILKAAK